MATGTIHDTFESLNVYLAPSGSLDSIVTRGIWLVETGSSHTDLPEGSNGFLFVFPSNISGKPWIKQVFLRIGTPGSNDGNIYLRETNNGGTSWGEWWKFTGTKVT